MPNRPVKKLVYEKYVVNRIKMFWALTIQVQSQNIATRIKEQGIKLQKAFDILHKIPHCCSYLHLHISKVIQAKLKKNIVYNVQIQYVMMRFHAHGSEWVSNTEYNKLKNERAST